MGKDKGKDNVVNELMTPRIWSLLVSAVPPHRGFKFQPVECDGYIGLRVFLDNFADFSEPQRQDLALWIGGLCSQVRDLGVPCFIEGAENEHERGRYAGRKD